MVDKMMVLWIPPGLSQAELQDLLERWANQSGEVYIPEKPARPNLYCKSCGELVDQENAHIYVNYKYGLHMTTECMESWFDSQDEKTLQQFFRKES